MTPSGQKIRLVMIVKNESHVLERCLSSVLKFIDSWVIVDTGSTDGTQDVIRNFLKDIPGELYERPWVDFGYNRTEVIKLAQKGCDYLLMIDADEILTSEPGFMIPDLKADGYMTLRKTRPEISFYLMQLLKSSSPWRYEGPLHEVAVCEGSHSVQKLEGLVCTGLFDSSRNRNPNKYADDALVFEKALSKDPNNARNVFYLAQSYRDSNQLEKSLKAYRNRMKMGGWDEEIWYSSYQSSLILNRLGKRDDSIISFLRTHDMRPSRAEPLCDLARIHRIEKNYESAYMFAKTASSKPIPNDILFLDSSVYEWRALDELCISSYWTGRFEESFNAAMTLTNKRVPFYERKRISENLNFAKSKLK